VDAHSKEVERLQEQIKRLSQGSPLCLHYASGHSNTTRTKAYNQKRPRLEVGALNRILKIDPEKRTALVEPRVTMEELVKATLVHGLCPPVVPEFKGITVGGAIMGGSAESASHKWGGFHDACKSYEIILGDGSVMKASPQENADVFYGIAGSYGSLGMVVSAEIELTPAEKFVHLQTHTFTNPIEAISHIQLLSHDPKPPDFLDGIVFGKDLAIVVEGRWAKTRPDLPLFSTKPAHSEWYFHHAKTSLNEAMEVEDYLFRYDLGAFWMGAYLFRLPLLMRFIGQGILKLWSRKQENFTPDQVAKFHKVSQPNLFWRTLARPLMSSQRLWNLQHKAEKWIQDRMIIQDFCIPENYAARFLKEALDDPGTFPMWLCPIKGTSQPQIFAPHLASSDNPTKRFINIGIYGLPSYFAPLEEITRKLEHKTYGLGGRKVLYSRSYYTPEEFWRIYSKPAYDALREKMRAQGVWSEITDKVLSV
jgi:hypothetical protein